MRRSRHPWTLLAAAVVVLAGCADRSVTAPAGTPPAPHAPVASAGPTGQLQYFGYVSGIGPATLNGTDSYANVGWFSTDSSEYSQGATSAINSLAAHNMKVIIDMGNLLWCGTGQKQLCSGWQTRLGHWIAANRTALGSGAVLAFSVRDEPFHTGSKITQVQLASKAVKDSFPSAQILLIEAATEVADLNPVSSFNQSHALLTTVDWIAVDDYAIHPGSDATFQSAVSRIKAAYPGRKTAYAMDGWWEPGHEQAFGTTSIDYMVGITNEWMAVASADPDAVLMAAFIWDPVPGWTTSRNFPRSVLLAQTAVGRQITGRTRAQQYAPIGVFESTAGGWATGWACDPDGAWGESVTIDFYTDGAFVGSGTADQLSDDAIKTQCRSGIYHRFRTLLSHVGARTVAVVHDLDAGTTSISPPATVSVAWVKPASASWGQPNTLTAAGYTGNGSGNVQMYWRDVSTGGGWNAVAYQAPTAADGTWSNTVPTSNYCHDYAVYATYSGATSPVFTYGGLTWGYCTEAARVIWIQPAASAGFGPAGSMVVAGSATGAPSGTLVQMYWRDATAGSAWTLEPFAAPTDANGIWYNSISNAVPGHQYTVYVMYDVVQSASCTSDGSSGNTWC